MPHRAVREGDEYYCPVCNLRWGVNEDEPGECAPYVNRVEPPDYLKKVMFDKKAKRVTGEQFAALRRTAENGFKDWKRPDDRR